MRDVTDICCWANVPCKAIKHENGTFTNIIHARYGIGSYAISEAHCMGAFAYLPESRIRISERHRI